MITAISLNFNETLAVLAGTCFKAS